MALAAISDAAWCFMLGMFGTLGNVWSDVNGQNVIYIARVRVAASLNREAKSGCPLNASPFAPGSVIRRFAY
jgi:hypothetical protein